jgi:hypothetical protein
MTDQKRDPLALVGVLDRAETCFEPSGRNRVDPVPRPAHFLPVPAHHFLPAGRTRPSLVPRRFNDSAACETPPPGCLGGLAIECAAFSGIVRWEEQRLLSRFGGGDYRAYLAEVPRWVPRPPSAAKDPLPAH